ncbi:spore coat protein GerQ [Peribacillus deserti]|nr:spore coat protein GerQ [Peribacillus deserti]
MRQSSNQNPYPGYTPPYNPYTQAQQPMFQQQPGAQYQQLPGAQPQGTFQPPTPEYPGGAEGVPAGQMPGAGAGMGQPTVPGGGLPPEQSYIENILRLNRGKLATVYATFENNREWNAKIFKGIIEAAGRDHIILSDPQTGMRYLILMVYVDYVTFDEEIEYEYPYAAGQGPRLATYPPR